MPWDRRLDGRITESRVENPPWSAVVGVVEHEEQDLVPGHVREVPPLVVRVVMELRAARDDLRFVNVGERVVRDAVDEIELVGKTLVVAP